MDIPSRCVTLSGEITVDQRGIRRAVIYAHISKLQATEKTILRGRMASLYFFGQNCHGVGITV